MIYLLDTSTFSLLEFDHQLVMQRLAITMINRDKVLISTVTIDESLGGWYTRLRKFKDLNEQAKVHAAMANSMLLLSKFAIVPMTASSLHQADQFIKAKINIGRADCKIAALALEMGAVVVTRNIRDFNRISGVACEDWSS
jgi:tRNA(fMet)-specific endonuclease VapC